VSDKPPRVVEILLPPSPATVAYERGRAAFERGDHRAALDAMREALKLNPRFPNAHNYAGWILFNWPSRSVAELDAAIADFREAVLIGPWDDAPLTNLCDALVAAGREEEATTQAEQQSNSGERNAAVAYNWLGWRALSSPATLETAVEHFRAALLLRWSWGVARSNLAKALEMSGHGGEAYEEHARALDCKDAFNRAFSHERRGAFEVRQGWLRNALESFRHALKEDRTRGAANEATYEQTIAWLERELRARGIDPDETDRVAWARARELEIPAGFGARNEWGEPLADDVIEVERLVRQERWADAVAALQALTAAKLVDAIGYASWGAKRARRAGDFASAIAMQEIVVNAYRTYASWASSGGEGMSRMLDVDRERKKLDAWKAELARK
jgi:tetratricopeptide (TPR) repeat protein